MEILKKLIPCTDLFNWQAVKLHKAANKGSNKKPKNNLDNQRPHLKESTAANGELEEPINRYISLARADSFNPKLFE